MRKKQFVICGIVATLFIFGITGCTLKDKNTKNNDQVGLTDKSYVIDTSSIGGKNNISIDLPEGFSVIGDTDETLNSYVSFYHAETNAKEDDYIITYTIAQNIEDNREETIHTYKNMYTNFMASDISTLKLNNGKQCKYYTITYMLTNETLTDYVFEFDVDGSKILAKLGTTFYPLQFDENEAAEILYKYL